MEKTFTVVGTSVLNGVLKVRFANDLATRKKVLERNKHTAINLIECAAATKVGAVKFAATQTDKFNAEEMALFAAFIKANDF
jgi:hypothetical protein